MPESNPRARGAIVVINAGSSSLKFALFHAGQHEDVEEIVRGEIEALDVDPHFISRNVAGAVLAERHWARCDGADLPRLLGFLIDWIEHHLGEVPLRAAGHRVALGGLTHSAPVVVDAQVLARLRDLIPLAPLHQPHNLAPIDALAKLHPHLPQVACFDTAFHRSMPSVAQAYGVPRRLSEAGARRHGFHGLSYEYIAGELPSIDARAAAGRTVVAHLGNGASLCALRAGRSVATTMGFSALSGLVMGTRPGELDAGLVLWLLRQPGMSIDRVEAMLYHESGLAGVSGLSGDMRTLLDSIDPHAREAVDLFVYRIGAELGALCAALQGLDALVFTAGIGEHAPAVRAAVCRRAAWLGIVLDDAANARGGPMISAPHSAVSAWVIATDEERAIARHVAALAPFDRARTTA